ncbi:POZ domain-containing protein [Rhizophagus irregularis]|uniref:POZ domain-containing protein n=1 Tax=Rhizophagus irregularis TaxID=588596 RepID=A0A2N0QQH0_9GLOM|nr:POZ domain-containing protein [Rhizophagus irregularis]
MSVQFFSKLSQNYIEILDDDEYYDVTIEVGEDPDVKIFRVHMIILCHRSPFLRRALASKKKNDNNNLTHIKLSNISPEIFQIILKYLYGGILSLNEHDILNIFKILIAADELLLQELVDYLQNYFIENNIEWLEQNFELVHRTTFKSNNLSEIQQFCIDFMAKSPEKIFKSLDFTSWIDRVDFNNKFSYLRELYLPFKYELLLRGSRGGFYSNKFHELCDNKSNTVTFIKVKGTGEILGGYNPSIWKTSGGWGQYLDSFIFSFKDKNKFDNSILSRVKNMDNALYFHSYYGPSFGDSDLKLSHNWSVTEPFNYNICRQDHYEKTIRETQEEFHIEDYELNNLYSTIQNNLVIFTI